MQIECQSCGAEVPADNINLEKLVAKCEQCNAVFGFDVAGGQVARRDRPNIGMPKGLTVENFGSELIITRSWRHPVLIVFMVIFTLFWNGMVWPFFIGSLNSDEWFISAFLSIFVFVGALVGYFTLGVLLNSTEIRVSSRRLTVKSGPLPFPGNVDVDSSQIDQLWVEQSISHNRSNNGTSSTSVSFPVYMRLKDGKRKALIRSSHDSEMSLFLEQEIETFLGIEDRAVRGEF